MIKIMEALEIVKHKAIANREMVKLSCTWYPILSEWTVKADIAVGRVNNFAGSTNSEN